MIETCYYLQQIKFSRGGQMAYFTRRRDVITLAAGAATLAIAWPLAARAQQRDRMRRIGAFLAGAEGDQLAQSFRTAFEQGLAEARMDRWPQCQDRLSLGDRRDLTAIARLRAELVGLRPDVLFAGGTPELAALQQATRSIPIVFALVADPVGGGFVASFARPGGNITGFMTAEPSIAGKWLEMLKEAAPEVRRVAFLYNPETAPYVEGQQLRYAETAAAAYAVELIAAPVHNDTGDRSRLRHTCARAEWRPHRGGRRIY